MSVSLSLDIALPLDRFRLEVLWETAETALGVFGPSGSGKTSLLESIAGLRRGARGVIRSEGRTWMDSTQGFALPPERRGVGLVPQDARLFPHRDVMGNVLAGRRRALKTPARRLEPDRVLEILELTGLERADVSSLSGGERQRVALARALCSAPDLLLLDEPLAGLDLPLRRKILPYLIRVQREFAVPTLFVSHDATEVRLLSREAIVLRDGRVLKRGAPDTLFTEEAVLPLAWAEGFENVLRGRVVESGGATATVEMEPGVRLIVPGQGLAPGRQVAVTVRPEDLILAVQPPAGLSAQNVISGSIGGFHRATPEEEGDGALLAIVNRRGAGSPILVAITTQAQRRLDLRPGTAVHVVFKAQACRAIAA